MSKRVIVIASGETERRSLPHLLSHLQAEGIFVVEVRRPDGNKLLNVEMAVKLVKAAWWSLPTTERPQKFVILLDADGKNPEQVLGPFREQLPKRVNLGDAAILQFACARWHLETWYFADATALRTYLGRDLGDVDTSQPDEIHNPKQHLRNLLGNRMYTAAISEEIARLLDARSIVGRSPSFEAFVQAVINGDAAKVE
jgi:hypothetical protein